ncbi:T9SS type A sorting domain-containing protein [bacterium]|nr:T9SS type A sorting domain-containing protein [bacterium]
MKYQFSSFPVFTFLLMIMFLPVHVLAQNSGIDEVGRINGWDKARDLFVRGDYAFVTTELSGLQILNISDPESPELVGFWDDNPLEAQGVYVSGDYAYITDGKQSGLRIIDISNPENPTETGYLETLGIACDVFVVGNYAYVSEGGYNPRINEGALRVVDISDPENPQEIGFQHVSDKGYRVWISGNYAYLACIGGDDAGLIVFDVSDPEDPDSVGYFNSGETADIFITGETAYVTGFKDDEDTIFLFSLDISDPSNPQELDRYNTECQSGWGISISDDYLYLAGSSFTISVFNISDPGSIDFLDFYDLRGINSREIFILDDVAYITANQEGFCTVDISDPENVRLMGQFSDCFLDIVSVSASEDIAVFTDFNSGLQRMIDISDPSDPVELEVRFENRLYGRKIVFSEGLAYLLYNRMHVYDLSNPVIPVELGSLVIEYVLWDFVVNNDFAFGTFGGKGLASFNVASPSNPFLICHNDTTHRPRSVSVSGNLACVVNDDIRNRGANLGMYIIDVSNPNNIEERGFLYTFNDGYGSPDDVYSVGNYAYLTTHSQDFDNPFCLNIIDISDPDNPERIGFCPTPGKAEAVWVAYDYAYIADAYAGLRVIDISNPEEPEEVCWFDTPGYAWDVFVEGDLVYVADQTGMGIYDCSETINVVPQWVDIPRDRVEFTSGDLIEINLTARDRNDDELTLDMAVVDLPDNIEFRDNGDGSAGFRWQTTEGDSGIYHPIFIASDGELNDSVEVVFFNSLNNEVELDKLPVVYELISVYPNPFNSSTSIRYSLDRAGFVTLKLYDLAGREVASFANEKQSAGHYCTIWNAEGESSGMYLLHLNVDGRERVTKLILIR